MKKRTLLLLSIFLLLSCKKTSQYSRISHTSGGVFVDGDYMFPLNTLNALTMYEKDKYSEVVDIFDEKLNYISSLTDRYHDYENIVNLKTLNDSCGSNEFINVPVELFNLIDQSIEITKNTLGKYNLALGSLIDYYNEFFEDEEFVLNQNEINDILTGIPSYDVIDNYIELNKENNSVKLNKCNDKNIVISLGGNAKGYANDILYNLFKDKNYNMVISNGGSTMSTHGQNKMNDQGNFLIGFNSPSKAEDKTVINYISITGTNFISTSADDSIYKEYNGNYYHHILDSNIGKSNSYFRSVSLLSRNAPSVLLDSLSTAIFNCSSIQEAKELINSLEETYSCQIDYLLCTPAVIEENISYIYYNVYINEGMNSLIKGDYEKYCLNHTII